MGNLTTALVFVMAVNVIMFLAQASILELNPAGDIFYTNDDQLLQQFDKNAGAGDPVLDTEGTYGRLPAPTGDVSPTTGNFFTDAITSIKNWLAKTTGLSYLISIVSAPYNFLKALQLPNAFSFALGTLWYGITLLLIIAFILGRDV